MASSNHGQPAPPDDASGESTFFVEKLRGIELRFRTRPGVFAPKGLDDGTRLLIEHLDLAAPSLIADLGCGGGVLGAVCARLYPTARVHLLDDNLRAVELARTNLRLNGVSNADVFLSDLFSAVDNARYSHILSNPPAQLGNAFLTELVEQALAHLQPGGELWLVVMKNLRPVFVRLLERAGATPHTVAHGRVHDVLRAVAPGGA